MMSKAAMGKPLRIENLSKVYEGRGERLEALGPISLDIAAGEFLVVVGPSGCGKSTLLQILAGFMRPTTGEVLVDDVPISGPSIERSMVFQSYALFPWLSVSGNVEFGLERKGIPKRERREIALAYLQAFGLRDFADKGIDQLSGGMKQRVAIARAFAVDPSILLMDEPFGALDALTRRFLQQELVRIWSEQQRTVVFITHSVEEALVLGDRIIVMTWRPGRIKAEHRVHAPRPRDVTADAFRALSRHIYSLLDEELAASFNVQPEGPPEDERRRSIAD
jgi:NitT/TauT family transport system ATP-binding protein